MTSLGVEANIQRFLEAAKMLEADFLRKQMYICVNHPEEVTKEVCKPSELLKARAEKLYLLLRKEKDVSKGLAKREMFDDQTSSRIVW